MTFRQHVETNLATVSVGNTPMTVVGETITLNYYTASRAITVMFNGHTTMENRLPYLTARMSATKFDNSVPAGLLYDEDSGAISCTVAENRASGDSERPGHYGVTCEFGDLDKFSHRDLIDFRTAILAVTFHIPKAHSDFRRNTMRGVFDTPKMQQLNVEKFPPQLGLSK